MFLVVDKKGLFVAKLHNIFYRKGLFMVFFCIMRHLDIINETIKQALSYLFFVNLQHIIAEDTETPNQLTIK